MPADNSALLKKAARERADQARRRVGDALRRLDHSGGPVNVSTVAAAAAVSRTYLYSQPDLINAIAELRSASTRVERVPRSQRASEASLHTRIDTLTKRNHQLRDEIAILRRELSVAHADLRRHRRNLASQPFTTS